MDNLEVLPNTHIGGDGIVSGEFLRIGIDEFINACRYVHKLPYGYNSDRDDLLILFKEGMGTCSTKHAVIATLAEELKLPVVRNVGIYAMTEDIVTGAGKILEEFALPYIPMIHCFLSYAGYSVDLTEGNRNGKNRPIDHFLFTETVPPDISAKDEYLIYRNVLKGSILLNGDLAGADIRQILQARERSLLLLKQAI